MSANKLLAALLCLILLLSSCAGAGSAGTDSDDASSSTESETAAETTAYAPPEAKDFGGYEYRFISTDSKRSPYTMTAESENGEAVNDAIYGRNLTVEDKYNIKITEQIETDATAELRTSVAANDDICDAAMIMQRDVLDLAAVGYLTDFNAVDEISKNMPWWDSRVAEQLTVKNKLFMLSGDITTTDDMGTFTVLFNKAMYNEYVGDDPYEVVKDGRFTLDKLNADIKGVSRDLDGDGDMDENDQYGILTLWNEVYCFYLGSGENVIEQDGDGQYFITIGTEKAFGIIEDIYDMMVCEDSIYDYSNIKYDGDSVYTEVFNMFGNKQILYNVRLVGDILVFDLRDMDSDYGFLPVPKYTEEQDNYYCWLETDTLMFTSPVTVTDTSRTGLISDAIAYQSMADVREPFYDFLLNEKMARSDGDKEMLAVILNNKCYDLDAAGATAINTGIWNVFGTLMTKNEFTLASSWAKIEKSATQKLAAFLDKFQ